MFDRRGQALDAEALGSRAAAQMFEAPAVGATDRQDTARPGKLCECLQDWVRGGIAEFEGRAIALEPTVSLDREKLAPLLASAVVLDTLPRPL